MKSAPKIGLEHRRTFTVEQRHLIVFSDDQMPAVLSTPNLILEMEITAREALEPFLDDHERSVGVSLDIAHSAPSLLGFAVTCRARVLGVEGDVVNFQIEASDEIELLSRGHHRRRVVDTARLRRRIEKKQAKRGG
ncbi:Fluoroacetyl-CoA thioesterase [Planctomycetes bacterium Pan216]|uniref:Fluoroacetyl-CoA thioesterase n=1 Tax=Kolteria novifilia TaxID=2527975 RepID=A0A518B6M3_9BACT|nr:Fluoroacetyl-CoA thioesterase [Planctomycetes bacterium Pan216]